MKKQLVQLPSMLNLFTPWDLRQQSKSGRQWWENHHFKPVAGVLTQQNMVLGFNLETTFKPNDSYDPTRLYVISGGSTLYVQAINAQTQEALVYSPHLPECPHIVDRWYLIDIYELNPVTIWGFNEAIFREKHPEKPCPYPVLWGSCRDAFNRRINENELRKRTENQ
ncbi:hypothetical protein [Spirosoma pomorum]